MWVNIGSGNGLLPSLPELMLKSSLLIYMHVVEFSLTLYCLEAESMVPDLTTRGINIMQYKKSDNGCDFRDQSLE